MSQTPATSSNPLSKIIAYIKGHPFGFWFLFWGELAERCSYYGMLAILTFYMNEKLLFSESDSSRWAYYFQAATYLTPLIGGIIADRFLGRYWTIVGFAVPYVIGNWLMTIPLTAEDVIRTTSGFAIPPVIMLIALVILAFGSGVIKPNLSTLLGMTYDQQKPGELQLRSTAFSMFYWAINVGSLLAQAGMPWLRSRVGYNNAYWLPTILMVIALILFALGRKYYAVETIHHKKKTPEERAEQWSTLAKLLGVFVLCAVFWSVMKHYNTVWLYFTREKLDTTIFGTTYKADQFQQLNAWFILTLLPLSTILFTWMEKRGHKVRPTDKMQLGFVFTALTPLMFVLADQMAGTGKTSILWLVAAYFCMTVAEILISPVGLELAFVAAPKSMKGFITACFLFTIFSGTLINSQVTPIYSVEVIKTEARQILQATGFMASSLAASPATMGVTMESGLELSLVSAKQAVLKRYTPTQYFSVQLAICIIAVIVFYFIAKPFNRRLAEQEQSQP
ncbi:MAG: MFS transporter [Planctomycetia bacterium]|nr:MFS transporter [Planctomycetia bacterium]